LSQDPELAAAASTVIVTCEEVVSSAEIARSAHMTKIPGYLVDAVIEVPFGAHPCSHVPLYAQDAWEILDYQKVAVTGGAEFDEYVARLRAESEDDYRARVLGGGRDRVLGALAQVGETLVEREG
jgi:glutaconate CoA-transferase subunit A